MAGWHRPSPPRRARGAVPAAHHDPPWTLIARPPAPWRRRFRPLSVRATRKPLLLFRLPVVFLFRFAARRFLGLLFQEPPRKTRSGEGQAPAPAETSRRGRWTGACARCSRGRRARSRNAPAAGLPLSSRCLAASGRAGCAAGSGSAARFLRAGAAGRRATARTQERRRLAGRQDHRLARMELQPPALQVGADPLPPLVELRGVVVEQCGVVDVAQVSARAQHLLAEVVEPVEMDVGEELAGQVADSVIGNRPPKRENRIGSPGGARAVSAGRRPDSGCGPAPADWSRRRSGPPGPACVRRRCGGADRV